MTNATKIYNHTVSVAHTYTEERLTKYKNDLVINFLLSEKVLVMY